MAAMQDDQEQVRSFSNGDRQECASYAEDDNEKARERGGRRPAVRLALILYDHLLTNNCKYV